MVVRADVGLPVHFLLIYCSETNCSSAEVQQEALGCNEI